MKKCAVIGSINMDMVTRVDRFPRPGETRMGISFATVPGGKGANQAVALGKLGVPVRMAGRVGGDGFGKQYLEHFASVGVDTSLVKLSPQNTTGTATIEVSDEGENHIVVVAGANLDCDIAWLEETLGDLEEEEMILLQLEIPHSTVWRAIARLHEMGKTIVLDPAPAVELPEEILPMINYLTPNETELRILTPSLPEEADAPARIRLLLQKGVQCVVHKAGAHGAYLADASGIEHIPGYAVKAVDTTAAGDTFNAGFVAGLAMGLSLQEAVRMGNAAGAISVTAPGAQGGMPDMRQVEQLLRGEKA